MTMMVIMTKKISKGQVKNKDNVFRSQFEKENFSIRVDLLFWQVKNKEGLVKMTVSNGLMKNNFSYATVMTMSSEVGCETGTTKLICEIKMKLDWN